ncbi:MAG: LLM class F420-dependent oxidoreductase [bacterium]|nr:LLM class F420-dependent oxidoreductase [Deltaproteobacteria bacterium]MCP4905337.1 LLM class F420-dependent oxidoreductase [bacterium]
MEIGLILPNSGELANAAAIYRIAERAEALGFDALWTADHLVLPIESSTFYPYLPGMKIRPDARHAFIDPMIALAGVAARTSRIRLGVSVYLAALRHPIVAAKLVASLDQLSGGRVLLGVGSGWIPEEYETLGISFDERGRVLDEHLEAMRALWSEDHPRYEGDYYRFENIGFDPKPVASRIPIWVGGNSRPARRRAARLGDGWHVIDVPLPELRQGIDDLSDLCREAGRSASDVVISMRAQIQLTEARIPPEERIAPLMGPLDDVLDRLRDYSAAGVSHMALWPRESDLDAYLERMERIAAEILPAFPV